MPCSRVSQYRPVNGRSVPLRRATAYSSGVSSARHWASDFSILFTSIPIKKQLRHIYHVNRLCRLQEVPDTSVIIFKLVYAGNPLKAFVSFFEIGRASCRERVCQIV